MKKFLVLYRTPISAQEQMANMTPEDMKKGMEPWMAWAEKCGSSLVDLGTPLVGGLKLSSAGSAPNNTDVGGYSFIEAESVEAANALLEGHPHLGWADGCEIEIYESQPMEIRE